MTPSKFLIVSSLAILLGVATGSLISFSWEIVFFLFVLLSLSLLLGASQKRKVFLVISIAILFFGVGFFRFAFSAQNIDFGKEVLLFSGLRESLVEKSALTIGGQEQAMFAAMVLGHKQDLSESTKEAFNKTGTRHILAISGLHLTIVAVLLLRLLQTAGLFRRQAFWVALAGILFFILLVGSPPSAMRAGIMAALYLTAGQIGRLAQAWRLLLVAAVLMVLLDPRLLLFSVSFQLSFLAVLGIIFFKPFFDRLLKFVKSDTLRDLFSLSLSAQLTTWPIVAVNFGTVSLIGPLANLVAVPLLPVVMVLGLLFVVVGGWSLFLAKLVLWPAWLVLHFILGVVFTLAKLPVAAVQLGSLSILLVLFYYVLLTSGYLILKKKDLADI